MNIEGYNTLNEDEQMRIWMQNHQSGCLHSRLPLNWWLQQEKQNCKEKKWIFFFQSCDEPSKFTLIAHLWHRLPATPVSNSYRRPQLGEPQLFLRKQKQGFNLLSCQKKKYLWMKHGQVCTMILFPFQRRVQRGE